MHSLDGSAAPAHPPKRRWQIPLAMLRGPGETLEGIRILQEVPGDAGTVLWQTVRDVTLWAEAPPEDRTRLFHLGAVARRQVLLASADLDGELRAAAEVILAEILGPWAGDAGRVAAACHAIADRSERMELRGTALAFAQAASIADPDRASFAHEVGRYASAGGDPVRAESWFRRAVALARRSGDWATYCKSLIALGAMCEPGNWEGARKHYLRAMRAARRYGLRDSRGTAARGMVRVAMADRRAQDVGRYGAVARRCLGADHPQFTDLQLDIARGWIEAGQPGRAAVVLRRLGEQRPTARPMSALALLARAEANPENRHSIAESWAAGWALAIGAPDSEERSRALADLALSAAAVGAQARAAAAMEQLRACAHLGPSVRRDLPMLQGGAG